MLLIGNDGGTWVGRAKYFTYAGDPVEAPRTIATVGFTEFVGQGGYEGMRLFLVEQPNSVGERNWGIIVPVGRLPETPELVPDPSAVDTPVVGELPAAEGRRLPWPPWWIRPLRPSILRSAERSISVVHASRSQLEPCPLRLRSPCGRSMCPRPQAASREVNGASSSMPTGSGSKRLSR